MWSDIEQAIERHFASESAPGFQVERQRPVGGGCINDAFTIEGAGQRYFVKFNDASKAEMFSAEFDGLAAMAATDSVRVPNPIAFGTTGARAWIVMEHIDLGGGGTALTTLGTQLAKLHRATAARFGWHRDNTIGSTPQPNGWMDDWIEFLAEHRIGFQVDLAVRRGAGSTLGRKGERLVEHLADFFPGYRPAPSLLHGDLWGGNSATARSGEPVIFDPACYHGDREADLAMTELFGGFGRSFQAAYHEAWPIDPGYATRKTLYNLYHILNHYNLFGGGYAAQAESMMDRLLAEV